MTVGFCQTIIGEESENITVRGGDFLNIAVSCAFLIGDEYKSCG